MSILNIIFNTRTHARARLHAYIKKITH